MSTCVYLRAGDSFNPRPEIEAFLLSRGWTASHWYHEWASPGGKRPQFQSMMDLGIHGISVLVVFSLNQFSGTFAGNLRDVLALISRGVRVVSVSEPWLDAGGAPVIQTLRYVLDQERARLKSRIAAGMVRAGRRGVVIGKPCPTLVRRGPYRDQIVDAWLAEGRPGGTKHLGRRLGGCTQAWAWRIAARRISRLRALAVEYPGVQECEL